MFTSNERIAVFSLAAILAIRMLGLFIIIPVFSPYLQSLSDSTPLLIGITMGIYGLFQALLQIPFGILSDYIGRREVITLGLGLFLIGSVLCGVGNNIYTVLLGRSLQGAGAISSTVIALLSDLTSEESRTKAMAMIGMSIGASFIIAFMFGPMVSSFIAINKIFYITALLVVPVLYILWQVVPVVNNLSSRSSARRVEPGSNLKDLGSSAEMTNKLSGENPYKKIFSLIKNKKIASQLFIHSFGVFSLHGILMANFVALPILLKSMGLTGTQQGYLYIEVFIAAILFMLPMIIYSERFKQQKQVIILSIVLVAISELTFWLYFDKFWGIMFGLVLFFIGFNVLEASLPSIVSKLAPAEAKGAVLGVYSTAQFLGPMLGGLISGLLFKFYGLSTIFLLGLFWALAWFLFMPRVKFNVNSNLNTTELSS